MDEATQKMVDELNLVKLSGERMNAIVQMLSRHAAELNAEVEITLNYKDGPRYSVKVIPWGADE